MCEKNGSSSSDSDIIEVIDITGCDFFFNTKGIMYAWLWTEKGAV